MESDTGTGGSGLQDQHCFLDTHLDVNVCDGVQGSVLGCVRCEGGEGECVKVSELGCER